MGERITEREAARRLGKGQNSITHQRRRGNFDFGPDGKLDWDEVKANYQTQRPAANPEATLREQTARVTSTVVKANFGKVRLAHIERSYTERVPARDRLRDEVEDLFAEIAQLPAKSSGSLVLAFDLGEAEALAILTRVVAIGLAEIGDLREEAELIMEQA